ncbi:MAG: hypothetical protein ACRDGH_11085 [Candidatus Limnocylindria bacterium]
MVEPRHRNLGPVDLPGHDNLIYGSRATIQDAHMGMEHFLIVEPPPGRRENRHHLGVATLVRLVLTTECDNGPPDCGGRAEASHPLAERAPHDGAVPNLRPADNASDGEANGEAQRD